MSTSLGFSSFTENMENMENKVPAKKKKERFRNKTIKKRNSKKVENFLNSMNSKEGFQEASISPNSISNIASIHDDEENRDTSHSDGMGEVYKTKEVSIQNSDGIKNYDQKELEGFGLLKEGLDQQQQYHNDQQQYYNKNVPTYTGTSNNIPYYSQLANSQNLSGPKDDLMRKLNYVVHMLEGQQDEKTENVTEELVLYMFLGVFVIFVVDSFARAGKYTR